MAKQLVLGLADSAELRAKAVVLATGAINGVFPDHDDLAAREKEPGIDPPRDFVINLVVMAYLPHRCHAAQEQRPSSAAENDRG